MTNGNKTLIENKIITDIRHLVDEIETLKANLASARATLGDYKTDHRRLQADNTMLRTNVAQMRATIADYQRADAVAEAMAANNDVLRSVETRTYQTRGEDGEDGFGEYMFITGFEYGRLHAVGASHCYDDKYEQAIRHAVEMWKAREETK